MTYGEQTWINGVSAASAARMTHMEEGIGAAHTLVAAVDAAKENVGVAEAAAAAALTAAQSYADDAVAAGVTSELVYPQRYWDPVTSTWSARPDVPPGVVVTARSWKYPSATPPDGAQDGDEWKPAPTSIYRP